MLFTCFLLQIKGDLGQPVLQRHDQLLIQAEPFQEVSVWQLGANGRQLGQHGFESRDSGLHKLAVCVVREDAAVLGCLNQAYKESWRTGTDRILSGHAHGVPETLCTGDPPRSSRLERTRRPCTRRTFAT